MMICSCIPAFWCANVPQTRRSVGDESAGFPHGCYDAIPDYLFQVWEEDKRKESFCDWMKKTKFIYNTIYIPFIYHLRLHI